MQIKDEVNKLAKQKEYEQIYQKYGPKYFRKKVSKAYKNADIEKLEAEGRYIDIYEKYGEIDWVTHMIDMENELGRQPNLKERLFSKSILNWRIEKTKNFIKRLSINIPLIYLIFTGTLEVSKIGTYIKYRKEIQEYQKDIQEYSKKFDASKQSDMEIIMKVQKDLHEHIKGYGTPKINAFGYAGISIMDKNSTGVCKNFSCNIADKLNEINPKYHAREIVLYTKFGDFQNNNIENNIVEDEETIIRNIGNMMEVYKNNLLKQKTVEKKDGTENYYFYDTGKIDTYIENKNSYYKSIKYNEDGSIFYKYFANEEGYIITNYSEGIKQSEIISNGKEELIIVYDKNENEVRRTIIESNKTNQFLELKQQKQEEAVKEEQNDLICKLTGNHTMVAIDIEKDNVTLIIDPTNLGLGVYKDGKIIMFNEKKPDEATYKRCIIGEISYNGTQGLFDYSISYPKSFMKSSLSLEELEAKYGVRAQNEILKKMENEEKQKSIKDKYKIDKDITYDFNQNIATINKKQVLQKEER